MISHSWFALVFTASCLVLVTCSTGGISGLLNRIDPEVLATSDQGCPADEQIQTARAQLVQGMQNILQNLRIVCPSLPIPENGQVVQALDGNVPGTVANYSCDAGFVLQGNMSRECVRINLEAVWSEEAPICESSVAPTSLSDMNPVSSTSPHLSGMSTPRNILAPSSVPTRRSDMVPSSSSVPTRRSDTTPVSSSVRTNLLTTVFTAVITVSVALVLLVIVMMVIRHLIRKRRYNFYLGSGSVSPTKDRPSVVRNENVLGVPSSLRPSFRLRRVLPRRMVISSSELKILNSVGQGEFGMVFRAHWYKDVALPEVVAVKTLKGLFTVKDVDSLVEEILQMHTLSHPNVMSLFGVCLDSAGGPAVVMPFMDKGSVLDYLKKERKNLVPPEHADISIVSRVERKLLDMCLQISKGMRYLAMMKVVHRDLAARNCMMDAGGMIKVSDFGLSEDIYTRGFYQQNKDREVKLPMKWMPPESIVDGLFSEKSDVWSFGITCWEVFTAGQIPYSGISPVALVQLLRSGERLYKPMNPACSDEMYQVMMECWRDEPQRRPNFNHLVVTISNTLQMVAGYMDWM